MLYLHSSREVFVRDAVGPRGHGPLRAAPGKPLGRRGDFGDEVAQQRFVGERRQGHLPRLEPRGAGVDGFSVELDHAFLAGVDAGEADGEARVAMRRIHCKPSSTDWPGSNGTS